MVEHDEMVAFYTGFQSFGALQAFYSFLGPAVDHLFNSAKHADNAEAIKHQCPQRTLPPLEEFFMTLVRLQLGLKEQDLAYRFGISQPIVSRSLCAWINFLYLKLKEIPLGPLTALLQANMPQQFKQKYPNTRVVLDATAI